MIKKEKQGGSTMAKEQLSAALSARMEQEKANRTYTDRAFRDEMALRRHSNDKPLMVFTNT